jgi:Flp pilus assembly protein TadB
MQEYISIVALVISAGGLLFTYFGWIQKQNDRAIAQNERMTKLETKVDLFWKVVETNVGQLLKSPTHALKDTLLDKLAHRELSIEEAELLRGILTDEMQLQGRNNGVVAYALIIARLEQILFELRHEKK